MKISRSLAIAMMNADTSGMTEHEVELISTFPDFTVTDWGDDSNDINGICSITRLWDRVVEIELNNNQEV